MLRQTLYTVQGTLFVEGDIGRPMVQYALEVSKESIVDVRGRVVEAPSPVLGCTQHAVEVKIEEVFFLWLCTPYLTLPDMICEGCAPLSDR